MTYEQLNTAIAIFDDLKPKPMLPTNEAWHDPMRQELDRRPLTEVLELPDDTADQLDILRHQWCREPAVTSSKTTGPKD